MKLSRTWKTSGKQCKKKCDIANFELYIIYALEFKFDDIFIPKVIDPSIEAAMLNCTCHMKISYSDHESDNWADTAEKIIAEQYVPIVCCFYV